MFNYTISGKVTNISKQQVELNNALWIDLEEDHTYQQGTSLVIRSNHMSRSVTFGTTPSVIMSNAIITRSIKSLEFITLTGILDNYKRSLAYINSTYSADNVSECGMDTYLINIGGIEATVAAYKIRYTNRQFSLTFDTITKAGKVAGFYTFKVIEQKWYQSILSKFVLSKGKHHDILQKSTQA